MTAGYVKTLVCLANSRKPGGRCVAGKELANGAVGPWVRPVSARPSGELQREERWYGSTSGIEVGLCHVFHIGLLGQRPHAFQFENHLINPSLCLGYHSVAVWDQIVTCVDVCNGTLWVNGYSTRYGLNDQVPELMAAQLGESLKLLIVTDFQIIIAHEWPDHGNRRTLRGSFSLNGYYYIFKITDPGVEERFASVADGRYPIGEAIICISLSEPLKGYVYKLVASVITKG